MVSTPHDRSRDQKRPPPLLTETTLKASGAVKRFHVHLGPHSSVTSETRASPCVSHLSGAWHAAGTQHALGKRRRKNPQGPSRCAPPSPGPPPAPLLRLRSRSGPDPSHRAGDHLRAGTAGFVPAAPGARKERRFQRPWDECPLPVFYLLRSSSGAGGP